MEELSFEPLWPGGPRFPRQGGFPVSTDSVLLAWFAGGGKRCLDIGSGSGLLSLLIAAGREDCRVTGVELQPGQVEISRRVMARNGLEDRVEMLCGDIRLCREFLPAAGYDLVVSNPPYFPAGSGKRSPSPDRAAAREEGSCTLAELCAAAARLCRSGGRFCVVHRPERLSELLTGMSACGLEPKRLRIVQHRAGAKPSLILAEARRGARPGLSFEAPLVLCSSEGGPSEEAKRIYRMEGEGA